MRFNRKKPSTITINLAGGSAYKETDKVEFMSILSTSFLKDQFYRSADSTILKIQDLIKNIKDKKFIAKASVYTRRVLGMRSVSHLVASDLAKYISGEPWAKEYYNAIINRPDDMLEISSCFMEMNGCSPTNAMKKGFSKAIGRFDKYSLAKYRGENSEMKLIDLVNLIHPKPTERNEDALELLVNDKLRSSGTWESDLTKAGQNTKSEKDKTNAKKEVWEDLILNKKIKYFALLRNLRNIAISAPNVLDEALEMLIDRKLILDSLVLPFRFSTAITNFTDSSIEGSRKIIRALNKAVEISCDNVPKFEGKTLVALDVSGSMSGQPGSPGDIGALFSTILVKKNDCDLMLFDGIARYKNLNIEDSIFTMRKSIMFLGGSTNMDAMFDALNKPYNRIIILSDMQNWVSGRVANHAFISYKNRTKANPKIFSFDLAGYGSLQFPENNVFCLAGFSDKVFDTIKLLEIDKNAMVSMVNEIQF